MCLSNGCGAAIAASVRQKQTTTTAQQNSCPRTNAPLHLPRTTNADPHATTAGLLRSKPSASAKLVTHPINHEGRTIRAPKFRGQNLIRMHTTQRAVFYTQSRIHIQTLPHPVATAESTSGSSPAESASRFRTQPPSLITTAESASGPSPEESASRFGS